MTGSTTLLVCWWVAPRVITAPSLFQVTVVAGPSVEVQVRVLDWSYSRLVTTGEPESNKLTKKKKTVETRARINFV